SSLRAGRTLLAVHLGLEANGVLHYWFPAHNAEYARWSPGRVLLAHVLREGAKAGIRRVDFGRGRTPFKVRFMSRGDSVCEGCVDRNPISRSLRRGWWGVRQWVAASTIGRPAKRAYDRLMRGNFKKRYH
ncbi:MAG: GNAT family N-acetyltransferase, partial [Candidatus Hydrogenedentes bacterium]|nr:GNAT family N-acetyltransferase [Candidatus Hydrogenedentota bacterium]